MAVNASIKTVDRLLGAVQDTFLCNLPVSSIIGALSFKNIKMFIIGNTPVKIIFLILAYHAADERSI